MHETIYEWSSSEREVESNVSRQHDRSSGGEKVEMRPRISACMIVKNEERLLQMCLKTIKDLVFEIIVVDTGSSDRTVEIAQGYGAKVFHHPWEGDFSKHRNQSLSYSSGEWILVVDADEQLMNWDDQIAEIMMDHSVDSLSIGVKSLFANGQGEAWHNSIRIFRNDTRIRYVGRVHNQLTGWRNLFHSNAVIHHRGYALDSEVEDRKFERTRSILEKEIEEDPLNPKWHHYLAVAHLGRRNYEKAFKESTGALKLQHEGTEDRDLFLWTRFVASVSCLNTGRVAEAESHCLDAIRENPSHIDSHYVLASLYYDANQREKFLESSEKYLDLLSRLQNDPKSFGFMVHNTTNHEWRLLLHRGFCLAEQGYVEESQGPFSLAHEKCTDRGEFHKQMCLFYIRNLDYDKALPHLEKALDVYPQDPQLMEAKKSISVACFGEKDESTAYIPVCISSVSSHQPTISLCMMVKDEEKALPKCLDSVKGLVDEIIVVDTGSNDHTVEIAKSYGAKVYFHPWEEHFSKHRNQSIGYATKEWILILDADETLAPGQGRPLREAIRNVESDSIYVIVKSTFDQGQGEAAHNSLRIFRNNGAIRYEGRVHNRLVGHTKSALYPITITHEGYNLSPEQSRKKFLRTTTLLKRDIEENPSHPRAYHYLAASYLSQNMYREALEASSRAIFFAEQIGADDFIYLWSHFIFGFSCLKTGDLDQSERVCSEALKKSPLHLDSHFLLTIVKYHKGDWESCLAHSKKFIELCEMHRSRPGDFGSMVHNTMRHGWQVYVYSSLASRHLGRDQEEKWNLLRAEEKCPDRFELYQLFAQLLLKDSDYQSAEQCLREALKCPQKGVDIYLTGAQIFRGLGFSEEEMKYLEAVAERGPSDASVLSRLGAICLEKGDYQKAKGFLERALSIDAINTGARVNLGIALRRTGQAQMALSHLESAIARAPDSIEALSNLAYLYYELGQLEKAGEAFERLGRLDDSLVDVQLALCLIHTRTGDMEMTIDGCERVLSLISLHYDKTINSVDDFGEVFLEIGKKLIELGHRVEAFLALDVALLLSRSGQLVLKEFAQYCFSQGSYDSCIKSLEKGLRMGKVESDTLQLMGKCYERLGMEEASELCYQQSPALFTTQ